MSDDDKRETDTPRTDAALEHKMLSDCYYGPFVAFARQLERELAEALDEWAKWEGLAKQLSLPSATLATLPDAATLSTWYEEALQEFFKTPDGELSQAYERETRPAHLFAIRRVAERAVACRTESAPSGMALAMQAAPSRLDAILAEYDEPLTKKDVRRVFEVLTQRAEGAPKFPQARFVRYERRPELDKRISNGDDYAGDAWVRWVAVGHEPDDMDRTQAERGAGPAQP